MSLVPVTRPLRILLFSADSAERVRRRAAFAGCDVQEVADESSLRRACAAESADVLLVCGCKLPDVCWQSDQRPATVWVAPADADGPVDALLPPSVTDTELRECVELLGARAVLSREIEALASNVDAAFRRHQWRGGGLGWAPGEPLQLALTDPLTGAGNRRLLDQTLRVEFEHGRSTGKPISVLMLDLDGFKPINDTWGHRVGDIVLRQSATRLQRTMRGSDLVCRYGGDEFAVIAPASDARSAMLLAERLRAAISESPFVADAHAIAMTCSLGVASASEHEPNSAEELLHLADLAMLAAKRQGGNAVLLGP